MDSHFLAESESGMNLDRSKELSGLEFWQALRESDALGIAKLLGFVTTEVEHGFVAIEGTPDESHLNPIGLVHGGYAGTMLDSCMGAAVMTTLKPGKIFNTLETKVNYVRPLTTETGPVRAEGRVIHVGSRVGTAEGRVVDRQGKLYAHGTSTVLILSR